MSHIIRIEQSVHHCFTLLVLGSIHELLPLIFSYICLNYEKHFEEAKLLIKKNAFPSPTFQQFVTLIFEYFFLCGAIRLPKMFFKAEGHCYLKQENSMFRVLPCDSAFLFQP